MRGFVAMGILLALVGCGRGSNPPRCVLPELADGSHYWQFTKTPRWKNATRAERWEMFQQYDAAMPAPSVGVRSFSAVLGDAWRPHLIVRAAPASESTIVYVGGLTECRTESSSSLETRIREFHLKKSAWDEFDQCMSGSRFWELPTTYESPDGTLCLDGLVRRISGVREGKEHQVIRVCEGTQETKAATQCFAALLKPLGIEGFAEGTMSSELKEQLRAR